MEIRILLLFFLLTILTADVIAFGKFGLSRSSRGFSRSSSSRGSSSRGSSRVSSHSWSSPSHFGLSSGHKSSSSGHRIGSSSTGTISSQTVHHRNNDTSTSISLAKRRGSTRFFSRPFSQSSASYGNAGLKINDSSSFSHNSTENSTLSTSRNPDDPSISKKLKKRKKHKKRRKTKYLSNDEKSDAVAAIPVKKSQGMFDSFPPFPTLSTSFLPLDNKYNRNKYKNCQRMMFLINLKPDTSDTFHVDFNSTGKHFSEIKKMLCD